jgi:hypothetical protein
MNKGQVQELLVALYLRLKGRQCVGDQRWIDTNLMDVEGMFPRRQVLEIEGNRHSARGVWRERRCADGLTVRILEADGRWYFLSDQ